MPVTISCSPDRPATPAAGNCGSWWKDLAILAVVSGLWFVALLGMRSLGNPDEGRYGEIPP